MSKARLLPGSVYPAELGLTGKTVVVPAEVTCGKVRLMVANPTVPALVVTFEPAGVDVFDPGSKASHTGLIRPPPMSGGRTKELFVPSGVNFSMSAFPSSTTKALLALSKAIPTAEASPVAVGMMFVSLVRVPVGVNYMISPP
jgi:hypothetical protein